MINGHYDYSPWYHKLLFHEQFEIIYTTMLHAASVGKGDKKTKLDLPQTYYLESFKMPFIQVKIYHLKKWLSNRRAVQNTRYII